MPDCQTQARGLQDQLLSVMLQRRNMMRVKFDTDEMPQQHDSRPHALLRTAGLHNEACMSHCILLISNEQRSQRMTSNMLSYSATGNTNKWWCIPTETTTAGRYEAARVQLYTLVIEQQSIT